MDDPNEDMRARIQAQWRDNFRAVGVGLGLLTLVAALAVAAAGSLD